MPDSITIMYHPPRLDRPRELTAADRELLLPDEPPTSTPVTSVLWDADRHRSGRIEIKVALFDDHSTLLGRFPANLAPDWVPRPAEGWLDSFAATWTTPEAVSA